MLSDIFSELFELFFTVIPFIVVVVIIFISLKNKNRNKPVNKVHPAKPPKTVSSDGHVVPRENDPTCAKYGHVHEETRHRYIVHDEPVEGYVNLNGKLMTLKEAAKY